MRFAGQYYDSETGLHYNYHRYYDPKLGRYLRPDPIGLKGGDNLYAFVNSNPTNLIDITGLIGSIPQGNNNRLLQLSAYASTVVGKGNDCLAFVNIMEKAAQLNSNAIDFINDLQEVLIGEGLAGREGRGRGRFYVGGFSSSGFKKKFADPFNQVQHATAGLVIGSRYNWLIEQGVLYLEQEPQDDRLYEVTFRLGNQLNDGNFRSLYTSVRDEICEYMCHRADGKH